MLASSPVAGSRGAQVMPDPWRSNHRSFLYMPAQSGWPGNPYRLKKSIHDHRRAMISMYILLRVKSVIWTISTGMALEPEALAGEHEQNTPSPGERCLQGNA
ncbi:hypothetical protein [Thiolapillus sp.]